MVRIKNRQFTKITLIISIIIALLVVTPLMIMNQERVDLNSLSRRDKGYDYIQLSDGTTHYQLVGPESGPVVVFVHGFSVPLHDWDLQVDALTDAGCRVLRYDQFGRGLSDRPATDYTRELYTRQLDELVTALDIKAPFDIVGHSYGAGVTARYAVAYPEKIDQVVLLTPVLNPTEGNSAIPLARIPLFGPWFMRVAGIPIIESRGAGLFEESLPSSDLVDHYANEFSEQFSYYGTSAAITSLFRTGAFEDYAETYQSLRDILSKKGQSLMMVYGGQDSSVSDAHFETITEIFRNHRIEFFPDGLHSLNLQKPDDFNALLIDFLI